MGPQGSCSTRHLAARTDRQAALRTPSGRIASTSPYVDADRPRFLPDLVAGARMALEAMRSAPEPPPPKAIEILGRVLAEFDSAREDLPTSRPRAADQDVRRASRTATNQAGAPAAICSRTCAVTWSNSFANSS
jgi:hypothetical protein